MDDGMNAIAGPSSPMSYDAFASDAFAPLKRPAHDEDPWARMKQTSAPAFGAFGQQQHQPQDAGGSNPWAAFGRSTNGFAPATAFPTQQSRGRMPTPPDEDDEMMSEDEIDDAFDEEDGRRYGSTPALAAAAAAGGEAMDKRAFSMSGLDEQERVAALWQRGRRKT